MSAAAPAVDEAAHATLPQWWRARCREWGARPAMRHKRRGIWESVTWAGFFEQARALGLALAQRGTGQGDVLAILCENRPEWLCADMGAQAMGFVSQGLAPDIEVAELAQRLNASGARVLLVENAEQLLKALEARAACPRLATLVVIEKRGLRTFSDPGVCTYAELLSSGRALAADANQARSFDDRIDAGHPEQMAMVSDAANLPQRHLLQRVRAAPRGMHLEADDRLLSFMPLALPDERMLAMGAALAHGCLLHFPESADTVHNDLREVAPQVVHAPLQFWQALRAGIEERMAEATPLARGIYRQALAGGERPAGWRRLALRNVRASLGLQATRLALIAAAPASMPHAAATGDADARWFNAIGVTWSDPAGSSASASAPEGVRHRQPRSA